MVNPQDFPIVNLKNKLMRSFWDEIPVSSTLPAFNASIFIVKLEFVELGRTEINLGDQSIRFG